jgi:Cu-Zn family superoxide dismutase
MRQLLCAAFLAVAAIALQQPPPIARSAGLPVAKADLIDARGNRVGTAVLTQMPAGVLIRLDVSGLQPGERAFHIHESGRCEPPGFESAGGHFNPAGKEHGFANPRGHHLGDLPNLVVAEDGTSRTEVLVQGAKLADGDRALLRSGGTALVIHARADDYHTDPAGAAGDRLACGVIEKS